jgi:hypothetical protein
MDVCNIIVIYIITGSPILRAVILVIMFVENFTSDFITFVLLQLYNTSLSQTVPYVRIQHSFR